MKKIIYIILSVLALGTIITVGVKCLDENLLSGNGYTFYSNFSRFNSFKFNKSNWEASQASDLRWKSENISYKDGKMVLAIDKDQAGLSGGELFTKKKYGYGLYQVRMMPIKNSGVVSSFFNYANEDGRGTEIDIEFLGYDTTKVQFNYYTDGVGGNEYLYDLGFDASEDFHDYAFEWHENSIKWYVDGEQVYEANENIPQLEANIFMDTWPGEDEEWLGEYDGTAPLYAYYDWCAYKKE